MNRAVYTVAIIASLLILNSCSTSKRMKRAEQTYNSGEYIKAIEMFDRIYSREDNRYYRGMAAFYMAESYRKTNQASRAAMNYGRAARFGYNERDALILQASQLQKNGDYEDALEILLELQEDFPRNAEINRGIASCRLALDPVIVNYEVEAMRAINSRQSDFAPFISPFDPGQLFFSSMRYERTVRDRDLSTITGQAPSKIYTISQDSRGDWQEAEPLFTTEAEDYIEEGKFSMTSDGREAFFTRIINDEDENQGTHIWTMRRTGGRWEEPQKVNLGPDSLIYAHPAISPDGNTLYFVSDKPGNIGEKDIWKTERRGSEWETPVNMGAAINTTGKELYPYIKNNNTIFFSSDGHTGYGGLDIFVAEKGEDDEWEVSNLGQPINSSGDDFGITFLPGRDAGFFSSSRDSRRGIDNIYRFEKPVIRIVLTGKIESENSNTPPKDVTIRIIGTDGTNNRLAPGDQGEFNLILNPGEEYLILATAPGYFNSTEKINTKNIEESKQVNVRLNMQSAAQPLTME
ncbi:hypothetical protein QA597_01700 [Marinilabiliaceae bacterium ANBcel2]|nr:hypothetical protein [Marinilabiliaceae bacterium ANBcel2]